MAETATLSTEARSERGTRPAGRLRRAGQVPAVVYGLQADPVPISVPGRELAHILASSAGANTLITLTLDGDEVLALARQIQRHPARGDLLHVDFLRVRRDVAIQAEVPVHLVGEPEAVRDGAVIDQSVFSITVEAKPADVPSSIEVDISGFEIGDQILVGSLRLPQGVAAAQEPGELVAQLTVSRVAEELEAIEAEEEAAAAEAAPEEGEAAEEGEAEGGEAADGEGGAGEGEE